VILVLNQPIDLPPGATVAVVETGSQGLVHRSAPGFSGCLMLPLIADS
jgi:hypothetical protein